MGNMSKSASFEQLSQEIPNAYPPQRFMHSAHHDQKRTSAVETYTSSHTQSIYDGATGGTAKKLPQDTSARSQLARIQFERKVKRYFYQLTKGCGNKNCTFRLCASCPQGPVVTTDAAAIMAIQLASKPKLLFCSSLPPEADTISLSPFNTPKPSPSSSPNISRSPSHQDLSGMNVVDGLHSNDSPRHRSSTQTQQTQPFLHSLLSSTPFASLFGSNQNQDESSTTSHSRASSADSSLNDSTNSLYAGDTQPSRNLLGLSSLQQNQSLTNLSSKRNEYVSKPKHYRSRTDIESGSKKDISQTISNQDLPSLHEALYLLDLKNNVQGETTPSTETPTMSHIDMFTLETLVSKIPADATETDESFVALLSTVRTAFSSIAILKNSFSDVSNIPNHPSGLDINSIRESFHLLLSLQPREPVIRALTDATEILLAKLFLYLPQLQNDDGDSVRVVIIMLENPLVMSETSDGDMLLKKLALFLGSLKSRPRHIVTKWLSKYDKVGFSRILGHFQEYLCRHYASSLKIEESVIAATRVLSILNHANDHSQAAIVPYGDFYITKLYDKLNFKDHFKIWKRSRETIPIKEFAFFNYPFLFDPVAKTRIMHIDAMLQMAQEYEDAFVNQSFLSHAQKFLRDAPETSAMIEKEMKQATNPFLVLEIRREHLIEDAFDQIQQKEADLKKPLKVRFIGGGEEGMDQGGVQKEFFQCLVSSLLDPAHGLFIYDEETRQSWVNCFSLESETHFELVGVIVGLALYNGIILDVQFPKLVYKKLLDRSIGFQDLKEAFPSLGKGLQQLLDWTDGEVSDVFLRNFEISYEVYGAVKTIPLIQGGSDILVTNSNREEYVQLYTQHFCNESVKRPFASFRKGFHRVCGGNVLSLCRPEELELLICGNKSTDLDFRDLEHAAQYDDGYDADHQVIRWFWDIVHEMSIEQKKKLLLFVTASDRIPLKGLGNLTFVVQRNGPDSERLPTALTCFGRLLLPQYSTFDKLKDRLITAIENAKGFGLV